MLVAFWLALGTAALAQAPEVSETLAAQVMLDRSGFSPGEIDGAAGENLRRAVEAFQRVHGLDVSGQLDPPTWERLAEQSGNQPPLVEHTITDADVAGPFSPDIPSDLMAQARLERLAYRNALEALGEAFHASPRLLQKLNPDASFSRAGERIVVPNVAFTQPAPPDPGAGGARIVVTKATSALTVEDGEGRVLFHAPVTSGSEHDPLPIGTWKVTGVQQMPVFHYNPDLFWDANPRHSKAKIAAGPNNPVGVLWIDISKEHYGIHGTPEPSRVGHRQSHGCIRLTNWDVQRVAHWARPGIVVVFQ